MFKLSRFLKNYKKEVLLGPAFKIVEAIFELLVPLVMAEIIDTGVKNKDINYIFLMGGVMLLLGVVGLCSTLVCQKFASVASQGFGTDVRNALFKHILSFSNTEIDKFGTPTLITRLTNDINQMQIAVSMLIRLVVRAPFLVIGSIIMAMFLDLKLSLVFLAVTPLIALALYFIMSRSVPYFRVIQKKLDRLSLITRENLSGARVIRAFSKKESETLRFSKANDDLIKTYINVGKISSLLNPVTYVIMNLGIIAVIWFGGIRVFEGALSQGKIIAFVNYMSQILIALIVVANLVIIFTKAFASAARINEVFGMKPSIYDEVKEASVIKKTDNIESDIKIKYKDINFSYTKENEKQVLSDIKLDVIKGETLGIIGGTGSGKSTLVNLLLRLYDVESGEILIDGKDIKNYTLKELRYKIGMVPQNAILFSGTIAENLRYGNENATDEQIYHALKVAQALEFVDKLKDGIKTNINRDGKNLSGGQKQRLTIARAIVRDPDILILDDSASALDYATDAALRYSIKTESKDKTVIIISQRISTIKNSDKIAVLDDGMIVGIGTHDYLIEKCKIYQEIYNSQNTEKVSERNGSLQ